MDPRVRVKVFTVATDVSDSRRAAVRLLRDSCERCGHELEVLGTGEEWRGFGRRLHLLFEAIDDVPDDEVVLCVDAYDVVFLPSARDILRRFLTFDAPIVFGAETCCWPFADRADRYPDPASASVAPVDPRIAALRPRPLPPTAFKYLNAGSYIGYAGALRKALLALSPEDGDDDQGLFTDYFLEHPTRISLDHGALLFHTLHGVDADRFVLESGPLGLRSRITDSRPCLIHGNGSGKDALRRLVEALARAGWP